MSEYTTIKLVKTKSAKSEKFSRFYQEYDILIDEVLLREKWKLPEIAKNFCSYL